MSHQRSSLGLLSVGVAALLAVGLQATPASATQAFDGEVTAGTQIINQLTDRWATPDPIRDVSSASSFSSSPDTTSPFASSHASIAAQWDSADSGHVTINGGVTSSQGSRFDDSLFADESSEFRYRFTADADGVLNFDLNAAFTGDEFDIGTWEIAVVDVLHPDQLELLTADGYPLGSNTLELTGSLRLTAGDFYEFDLVNGGSTLNFPRTGFVQGEESGVLNWSITSDAAAVPEPASWALMLVGFGSAGAMLRASRRRTKEFARC